MLLRCLSSLDDALAGEDDDIRYQMYCLGRCQYMAWADAWDDGGRGFVVAMIRALLWAMVVDVGGLWQHWKD